MIKYKLKGYVMWRFDATNGWFRVGKVIIYWNSPSKFNGPGRTIIGVHIL